MSARRKRLLALVLALGFGFALGELGLRGWQALHGVPFGAWLPSWRPARFVLSPFLVFGPRVDWQMEGKLHPETSSWNFQGFRSTETLRPEPPAGTVRVIALGGSTTEDVWNEAGLHWPLVAERAIHASGRGDVRVYNGAMSAYTSAHLLVRFSLDVLQYEPDVVWVMENVNDLLVAYLAAREGVAVDSSYLVKYGRKLLTGDLDESDVVLSRLWRALRTRVQDLGRARGERPTLGDGYDLAPAIALFERNLVSLVAVARSHGVRPVLLTMPVARSRALFEDTALLADRGLLEAFPSYERFHLDFESYNEAVRRVAREQGADLVDAARLLAPEDRFFADLVHTTSAGVEAMGRAVAPELLARLPPRPPDPGS